jgi:hypothetical protein
LRRLCDDEATSGYLGFILASAGERAATVG